MSRLHEKAQAFTKQMVGQMLGDDKLVLEGKKQERHADEQYDTAERRSSTAWDDDASKSKNAR